jgi:hypothetical protein
MSQTNMTQFYRRFVAAGCTVACLTLALYCVAQAQQGKGTPSKASLTGHYEGSAKDKAEEVITVGFDLTEKDGLLSGMIHSSHGDFPIASGSHQGEAVTIEFDAGGATGTISLKTTDDRLVGTWTTGEDGGPVDVKKVAAPDSGSKDKS